MPIIDDGRAIGPSGKRLPNASVELSSGEARDLLKSLQAWEDEIRDGVLDPGWHTHVADEGGNELTIAIRLAASDVLAAATALDRAAEPLDPAVWPTLDVTTDQRMPIEAIAIVRFPGRGILVLDGEGTWWMGQPNASRSEIHCWGTYGRQLRAAFEAL